MLGKFEQFLFIILNKKMSQHGGSSIMSSENPELKYKKALKEISKLISANRKFKEQANQIRLNMQEQYRVLNDQHEDLRKQAQYLRNQNDALAKFNEQLQQSNQGLQKQVMSYEKQVTYLNQMLTEQNAEQKKIQGLKDEKRIAMLIRSYEQKQEVYMKEKKKFEDFVHKLKSDLDERDRQLSEEQNNRQKMQEKYQMLVNEVNKYKEMNNILISRKQKVFQQLYNKESTNRQKQRQIQNLVNQFRRQISNLKSIKDSNSIEQMGNHYQTSYQLLLQEKNRILMQYSQLKDQYQTAQNTIKENYNVEDKMKSAISRAQTLAQQCNMLKSKIIVLQSRQILDEEGMDFDFNPKQFDDKISHLISQSDPLITIKNSDDSSHFKILRSYIIELRQKLIKAHSQNKQYKTKYKSISSKYTTSYQQSSHYEKENKILRGKIQGYEKLTEKLQNQMEKNIMIHESQVTKMNAMATEMLTRKNQELETTMRFMKDQMENLKDKSNKIQKSLRQQVQSLKLQITALRIKKQELDSKVLESSEFLNIYKNKLKDMQVHTQQIQDKNNKLNDELLKYQHLHRDQKNKNQSLLSQKQQISQKMSQINEEVDKKSMWFERELKISHENFQLQIKRYKSQNIRLSQQNQVLQREIGLIRRDFQERKIKDIYQIQQLKKENVYYKNLDDMLEKQKEKNRQLQAQNETLKMKTSRYSFEHQKATQLQQELMNQNDANHDLKRKIITLESLLKVSQSDLRQQRQQNQNLRKDCAALKVKLLQSGLQIRKEYDNKDKDARQIIYQLNQEISELNLSLSQERGNLSRLNSQNQRFKSQIQRLQQFNQQIKDKEYQTNQLLNSLKMRYQQAIEEIQGLKTQKRLQQMRSFMI